MVRSLPASSTPPGAGGAIDVVVVGRLPAPSTPPGAGGDQLGRGPVVTGVHRARGVQTGGGRSLLDVAGLDVTGATGLEGQHDDRAAVAEVGQAVDDRVDEVAVVAAPPD